MTVPLVPMIPAMASRFEGFLLASLLGLGFAGLLTGCALPPPGPETPLEEGLARYGSVTEISAGTTLPDLEVVVLKDRHAVHGAITRERGALREVQRENRGAIGFLERKGFLLLGCEASYGPLPRDDDGPSAAHRDAVRRALSVGDDLHGLTVYQPIRYEEEFAGRLTVLGMEDPVLYAADKKRLEDIIELRRIASRRDLEERDRAEAVRTMLANMRAISAGVDERGRAAACNLIETMLVEGHDRAVLMLGGAHAKGAVALLEDSGARVWLFECKSYALRSR